MTIKAIETRYKGYRFRSRLEARWAVFFEAIGVKWEYEKQGFDMDGVCYLPDFYLPDSRLWVEIKPEQPTKEEVAKNIKFAKLTADNFVVLIGQPYQYEYHGVLFPATESGRLSRPQTFHELTLCQKCNGLGWLLIDEAYLTGDSIGPRCNGALAVILPLEAYRRARGARFEHGETPE